MTSVETLCGGFTVGPGDVLLYLDPRGLDRPAVSGAAALADTRWELRRIVETQVRVRDPEQPGLFVHCTCPDLAHGRDLPVDLAQLPWVHVSGNAGPLLSADLAKLPWSTRRALTGAGSWDARLAAAARNLASRPWPPEDSEGLTAVVYLLAAAPEATPVLRREWGRQCPEGPARQVLLAESPYHLLQSLWQAKPASNWAIAAADALATLAAGGYLDTPQATLPAVPRQPRKGLDWPTLTPAEDLEGWRRTAQAVASQRFEVATFDSPDPSTIDTDYRQWWQPVNDAWVEWLQAHYAGLLTKAPQRPVAVHRIPAFLSRQVVSKGERFVLLVLDGLGLAQWAALRSWLELQPLVEHTVLAGLPTITSVSRQSIFSGSLPFRFPDSIQTTAKEGTRWAQFWISEGGLQPTEVGYSKTQGATAADWSSAEPSAIATGVAAVAIDDLMHGALVNGDRQFFASLRTWAGHGYLRAAMEWARRSETQLWITSDHGNLAAHGSDRTIPQVGVLATRGRRVMIFESPALRDQWEVDGLSWQPPGFPEECGAPLFARGDSAFQRGGVTVSHGGLSLDEVFVPLVRVA